MSPQGQKKNKCSLWFKKNAWFVVQCAILGFSVRRPCQVYAMPTPQRSNVFIAVSILLTLYFLFAAAVQYNDPDPIHWMLLYLTSAVCCVLAALGKDRQGLIYALIGMAVIEMAMTGDGFLAWLRVGQENLITAKMTAEKPYIELGREFLGALISFAVALWQALRLR